MEERIKGLERDNIVAIDYVRTKKQQEEEERKAKELEEQKQRELAEALKKEKTWFRFAKSKGGGWSVGPNRCDAIDFTCTKTVFIIGFMTYGPKGNRDPFSIKFQLGINEVFQAEESRDLAQLVDYGSDRIARVELKEPVEVQSG